MEDIQPSKLKDSIDRLRRQSEPTATDGTLTTVIRYMNVIASFYKVDGRQEWAEIVGSTRENTKLKWTKDGGDVDIIFCSRRLEIPVDNLTLRNEIPCFVWIRGNDTARDLEIEFIDDNYLPSEILRTVNPKLFTFSRGIYFVTSTGMDTGTSSDGRFTTTKGGSKVGLLVTEYQGLQEQKDASDHNEQTKSYRATYIKKSCKDFVPVLKVNGKLPCMDEWRKRPGRQWPKTEDVENIYENCNVYVVSKLAPISPDSSRDFCLSFNEAEYELSRTMTEFQRDVMLILKAYLKGVYNKAHEENNLELKLTSFHLKTVLYWVSEKEEQPWTYENIEMKVDQVMAYLQECLERKRLDHYFIESNVFAGFTDEQLTLLIQCTKDIRDDPLGKIDDFFGLDDGQRTEIVLNEEEKILLSETLNDGGKKNRQERIRIAYEDIIRSEIDRGQDIKQDVFCEAASAVFNEWVEDRKDPSKFGKDSDPEGFMELFPRLIPEVKDLLEHELSTDKWRMTEGSIINRLRAVAIVDCIESFYSFLTSKEYKEYVASGHQRIAEEAGETLIKNFDEFLLAYTKFEPGKEVEKKSSAKDNFIQCLEIFLKATKRG